jgi:hypothetical protein
VQGVSWDTRADKWRVCAWDRAQKKRVYVGFYDIKEDVARAYQAYAEHGTLPAREASSSAFRGVISQSLDLFNGGNAPCGSGLRFHERL